MEDILWSMTCDMDNTVILTLSIPKHDPYENQLQLPPSPDGIFRSNFAYLFNSTLSIHWNAKQKQ